MNKEIPWIEMISPEIKEKVIQIFEEMLIDMQKNHKEIIELKENHK